MVAAGRWYEAQREGLGAEFHDAIDDTFERILAAPLVRRPRSDGPDERHAHVRRFPYVVVYTVARDTVFVVAVAHMHRAPGFWRAR